MNEQIQGVPAGWYPDPIEASILRWWDGEIWTGHVYRPVSNEPGAAPSAPPPTPKSKGLRPWIWVTLILAAVALIAVGIWLRAQPVDRSLPPEPFTMPVAPACAQIYHDLGESGTADRLAAVMRMAAEGGELADAEAGLKQIQHDSASVLRKDAEACRQAVDTGKAPTTYLEFVDQYEQALDVAAGTFEDAEDQPNGIDAGQAALLEVTATSLQSANDRVTAPPPRPSPA